jgi:hypothetical protein
VVPRDLGQVPKVHYDLNVCNLHGLSLGLAPLITCRFLWQTLHIAVISNFLGSPLDLCIYPHSFIDHHLRSSHQGQQTWYRLPDLPGLTLKYGWKSPCPHNSCILLASNTSITWRISALIKAAENRDRNACTNWLSPSFPFVPCQSQSMGWYHPHSGQVFPP